MSTARRIPSQASAAPPELGRPVTASAARRSRPQDDTFAFVRKLALALVVIGLLWIFWGVVWGFKEEPWEWKPGMDPVLKSRPDLRHHERYSPEHRYRPAASPILRETDRWGRVKLKGQYHP